MFKFIDKYLFIIALLIITANVFLINTTNVDGISMENTYKNEDRLSVELVSKSFNRQDVVIVFPDNKGQGFVVPNLINTLYQVSLGRNVYVKRVIGLPGESIEMVDKYIYIYNEANPEGKRLDEEYAKNDWLCKDKIGGFTKSNIPTNFKKVKIPENHYFIMGDNRGCSQDSRVFGPLEKSSIIGKVAFKINFWKQ